MKISFDRDTLLKEISIAQEIIATKTALTILSNVLLSVKSDSLTIKATDIKVTFETKIPVNVIEEGSTTVFCDKFANILSSLPSGEVELEQKDQKMTIKSSVKKAKFQLKTISENDFPAFTEPTDINFFSIPSKNFKEMIHQTVFSVSDDETRYFMNGVYIENKENNLVFVATDGRRLAFIKKNFGIPLPNFKGIIVPPKILNIINRHSTDEGEIKIAIGEKNIFFNFNSYKFSSVLIDGQFPSYDRVIPENQKFSFEVDRTELMEALKRVSLLVELKTRRIFLNVIPGSLIISSKESEIGNAREEIPCRYDGEEVMFAVNCIYLEEPLKAINNERVRIEFTEVMKPVTLKPEPEEDFFHIIMPMQVE